MDNITQEQAKRLYDASENLAAFFMAEACRIIHEGSDDCDLLPYLSKLPVKLVRDFDEAVSAIQWPEAAPSEEELELRRKYDAALAEMREARRDR